MEKTIVKGMRAVPGDVLYKIVDPSVIWVEASVYEPDLGAVAVGQHGVIRINALPDDSFDGRITPSRRVSTPSRERRSYFELPNRRGASRQACSLRWSSACPARPGLVVPRTPSSTRGPSARVRVEGRRLFEPRPVVVGHRVEGRVKITRGLSVGDQVAEGRRLLHRLGKPAPRGSTGIRGRRDLAICDSGPHRKALDRSRGLAGTLETGPARSPRPSRAPTGGRLATQP